MDTFALDLQEDPDRPDGAGMLLARINGTDLIEQVRQLEMAAGKGRLAGAYAGIRRSNLRSVRSHFLGSPSPVHEREDGKIPVLGCACGIVACWPLHVRVTVAHDVVTWDGFDPPFHRDPSGEMFRRYDAFGPFRFDRDRYEAELARFTGRGATRTPIGRPSD